MKLQRRRQRALRADQPKPEAKATKAPRRKATKKK